MADTAEQPGFFANLKNKFTGFFGNKEEDAASSGTAPAEALGPDGVQEAGRRRGKKTRKHRKHRKGSKRARTGRKSSRL